MYPAGSSAALGAMPYPSPIPPAHSGIFIPPPPGFGYLPSPAAMPPGSDALGPPPPLPLPLANEGAASFYAPPIPGRTDVPMARVHLHRRLPPLPPEPNVDPEWFNEQIVRETTHMVTAEKRQEIIAYHLADPKARIKWPPTFRSYARTFEVLRVPLDNQRDEVILYRVRLRAGAWRDGPRARPLSASPRRIPPRVTVDGAQMGARNRRSLPVPTREEVYDIIRACHDYDVNHGGIQATYKQVHNRYAMIPRRVVAIYCNACRHCGVTGSRDSEGRGPSGAPDFSSTPVRRPPPVHFPGLHAKRVFTVRSPSVVRAY